MASVCVDGTVSAWRSVRHRVLALGDPTYLVSQPGQQRALRFLALILIGQRLSYLVLAGINAANPAAAGFRSQVLNGVLLSLAVLWTFVFVAYAWQRGWFPRWMVWADVALSCVLMGIVTANCPPGMELTSMNWSPKHALATAARIGAMLAGKQALFVSLIPMLGYVVVLTEQVGYDARLFPGLVGHLNSCVWFTLLLFFMRHYLCKQSKALDEAVGQRVAVERERARFEERISHHRQLHDTVLATLTALARGGLDHRQEQVRSRCAKDAEYVRRLILEDGSERAAGLGEELTSLIGEAEEAGLRVHYMHGEIPEAVLLGELSGLGPEVISVFEQDEHVFLAETAVLGQSLGEWVHASFGRDGDGLGLPLPRALELARRLTALLAEVHARDVVYRDFTPGNVMLTPGGELKLIDPEIAARPGEWTYLAYTPGYAAPEALSAPKHGPAPELTVDLYSLGTVLFYLATGVDPVCPEELPGGRSHGERLAGVLRAVGGKNEAARALAPVVLGLTAVNPSQRWSLERAAMFLVDLPREESTVDFDPVGTDRLIEDGLAHILSTLDVDGERLWRSNDFGEQTGPCGVQHGAAGVLGVLTRASEIYGTPELREGVAKVAAWIDVRREMIPQLLPGLHFGRSGTAWALLDAAQHLGDTELERNAVDLALRLPVRWPNPDVCHGAAGSGMTQLHFWRSTGRIEFLERVKDCADGLLDAAVGTGEGVFWPVPEDFDSNLAGIRHYGFGHGVAGVGAFLLAAAEETGREDYLMAARAAGETLVAAAVRQRWEDGSTSAYWRTDQRLAENESYMRYHWCSGSSGIGTFLLRLGRAVEGGDYLALAEEAAVAVRRSRCSTSTVACHGLAGNGDFLLDLDSPSREWVHDLADYMKVRATNRNGLLVLPDETRLTITVDYGTGLAGALGFLLRLRHGGPRWWMPEGNRT